MPTLSSRQIQSLIEASNRYMKPLEVPDDDIVQSNEKLTYDEAASILKGKGWSDEGFVNSENFVLGYILDERHPERLEFLDILDEEVPPEYLPQKQYELTLGQTLTEPFQRYASEFWDATPAYVATGLTSGE